MAQANADQTMNTVNIMNIPEDGAHKLTGSSESTSDERFSIAALTRFREKPCKPESSFE